MANALIVCDPNILVGKPTIKGTRLSVQLILEELSGGVTIEQLLEMYPRLTREGIYASLAFAARRCRAKRGARIQMGELATT